MKIGIPKEIKPCEYRVAATPDAVKEMIRHGHEVFVESNCGVGSGFTDKEYELSGAQITNADNVYEKADIIYKVKEIFPEEYKYMNDKKILFTYIHTNSHKDMTTAIIDSGITSIAYEDVSDNGKDFPLLKPMSTLAGKGGFLAALNFSQAIHGGNGTLLNNVCGIKTPIVSIIGAGNSGFAAAELAASFGNEVRLLDVNITALENAKKDLPDNVSFLFSNRTNIESCLKESDAIINCILWNKTRKDHLVSTEDLKMMKDKAVIVDVACDDHGAIETCHATSHDDPVYFVNGVMHYAVDNIPSAFAKTASITLCNATLGYLLEIADNGVKEALKNDKALRRGLTTYKKQLTLKETADKFDLPYVNADELVKTM